MVTYEIELTWWQRLADLFYDFSAVVISVVDVVTDILITIQFGVEEQWAFFWIAVVIFGLAQFCYSALFTIAYAESLKTKYQMLVFVCVFPFAQIVPAFIWLDSYNLSITKSVLKRLKLETNAFSEKECPPDKDELQFWIEQKFLSHGGFVIEAVIEAFPQSILQMISLVMFYKADPLNVFSIVLSMTSVASKTLMFCYSIDRVTFFFNFLCMSADIFGVFCTLSWVFYHPDLEGEVRPLGWVWIWKIIVVSIATVVGGFFLMLALFLVDISHDCIHNPNQFRIRWRDVRRCFVDIFRGCRRCWVHICKLLVASETWKDLFEAVDEECCTCPAVWKNFKKCLENFLILCAGLIYVSMFPIAGIFLYGVAMMVLEIVKLSLLPLLFRNIDDKHRSNVRFYKPVFEWLLAANRSDGSRTSRISRTRSRGSRGARGARTARIESRGGMEAIEYDYEANGRKCSEKMKICVKNKLCNIEKKRDYYLRLAVANAYCCEDYLENVATSNKKGTWKGNKFMAWLLESADVKEKEEMIRDRLEKERLEREKKELEKLKRKQEKERKKRIKKGLEDPEQKDENKEDLNETDQKDENKENEDNILRLGEDRDDSKGPQEENANESSEEKGGLMDKNDDDDEENSKNSNNSQNEEKEEKTQQNDDIAVTNGSNAINSNNEEVDAISRLLMKTGAGIDNITKERMESKTDENDYYSHTNQMDAIAAAGSMAAVAVEEENEEWEEKDALMALGLSGFDIENLIEFRRRPALLPPDRLQFDYTNLLSVYASDLRRESDWSFQFFKEKYLGFFRDMWDENFKRDWQHAGCCGKFVITIIIVVFWTGMYVVGPVCVCYVIGSLLYPLVCLLYTSYVDGWGAVALLQKVLTFIYLSAISLLILLSPRVYKFQHANFHFIAAREGWWYSRSLDAPFQIKKRYVDIIATKIRNEMITTFFGKQLSNEMMKFLPPLHEVDEEWVEKVDIDVHYSPEFNANVYDYDRRYVTVDLERFRNDKDHNNNNNLVDVEDEDDVRIKALE